MVFEGIVCAAGGYVAQQQADGAAGGGGGQIVVILGEPFEHEHSGLLQFLSILGGEGAVEIALAQHESQGAISFAAGGSGAPAGRRGSLLAWSQELYGRFRSRRSTSSAASGGGCPGRCAQAGEKEVPGLEWLAAAATCTDKFNDPARADPFITDVFWRLFRS